MSPAEPDLLGGFPVIASALVSPTGSDRIVLVTLGGSRYAIGAHRRGERGWINETDTFAASYPTAFMRFVARVETAFEFAKKF